MNKNKNVIHIPRQTIQTTGNEISQEISEYEKNQSCKANKYKGYVEMKRRGTSLNFT